MGRRARLLTTVVAGAVLAGAAVLAGGPAGAAPAGAGAAVAETSPWVTVEPIRPRTPRVVPRPAVVDRYTSRDVGFAEGWDLSDRLAERLDGMTAFVAGRAPLLRVDLNWWYVQECATCALRWDRLDQAVDAATARGMRVVVILGYAPPWANGGHSDDKWFPTDDATWQSIVAATVKHLRGKAVAYEVWNEPNNVGSFSNYASDPKVRYWQLVRLASATVRSGCPECIVLAGASGNGTTEAEESATWLEWGYANGYGGTFDAVAHHPYPAWSVGFGPARPECDRPYWNMFGPPSEEPACGELAEVHAVMVRHGDTGKKIWGTEWGYPTSGASKSLSLSQIRDFAVQGVAMWRALPYTGPLFLYSYRDACTDAANPECAYGVVTAAGVRKEPLATDLSAALRSDVPLCTGGLPAAGAVASLEPGTCLGRGRGLTSPDRRFELWLQEDGNVVLYRAAGAAVLWATGTRDGVRLENRFDGDLVLSRADGTVAWHSGTAGNGLSTLWLQDDGNLVLYRGDARPTWATNTRG